MKYGRTFNFSAGPAMMPEPVLEEIRDEMMNYRGSGMCVMEMSHRSKAFEEIIQTAEQDIRDLLKIPDNYKVLFMHGGGRGQFAAVPQNLLGGANKKADYLLSGVWSKAALTEGVKFGDMQGVDGVIKLDNGGFKLVDKPQFRADAAYVHFCPNETIEGIEMFDLPETNGIPLVADMSSTILSRPVDVSQYGIIYAGAQKNIGPSGLAVVLVQVLSPILKLRVSGVALCGPNQSP